MQFKKQTYLVGFAFFVLILLTTISLGEVQKGLYFTINPPVFNGKTLTISGYATGKSIGAAVYDNKGQQITFKSGSTSAGKFTLSFKSTELSAFSSSAFYKVYVFDLSNTITGGVYEFVYFDNIAPSVSSITYEVYDKDNSTSSITYKVYNSVTGVYDPQNIFDPVAGERFIVKYNLSENSYVTVQVAAYDSLKGKGTVVATLLNGVPQSKGINYVTWSGLTNNGKFINNGTYIFIFNLKDLAGNTSSITAPLNVVVKKSSNSSGATFKGYDLVMPGIIDNYHAVAPKKSLKATFNFIEAPGSVSLLAYEKGISNAVYTLNPTFKAGSNTLNFTVYGNFTFSSVKYGVYYFRLLGNDVTGNPFDIYSSYFVLDNRPLDLENISVDSSLANRSSAGYNFASISFTLKRPALVTVQILDSNNKVVKNIINNNFMDGPVRVAWDLRDARGFVSTETYKVKITAADLGGRKFDNSSAMPTIQISNYTPF